MEVNLGKWNHRKVIELSQYVGKVVLGNSLKPKLNVIEGSF